MYSYNPHFFSRLIQRDVLLSLLLTLGLVALGYFGYLRPLEQVAYAGSVRILAKPFPEEVVLIAIDPASLSEFGELPWSRSIYAQLLDLIAPHCRVIGWHADLTHSQATFEQASLKDLFSKYTESKLRYLQENPPPIEDIPSLLNQIRSRLPQSKKWVEMLLNQWPPYESQLRELPATLSDFEAELLQTLQSGDQKLVASLRTHAHLIISTPLFEIHPSSGVFKPTQSLINHRVKAVHTPFSSNHLRQPITASIQPPHPLFSEAAAHIGVTANGSATFPKWSLVIREGEDYYPSFPLLVAMKSLQLALSDLEVVLEKGLRMGDLRISTDAHLQMLPYYYTPSTLPTFSFSEVLEGRVPLTAFQDKIVLLGNTARFYTETELSPFGELPKITAMAHQVATLINQEGLLTPAWAWLLQMACIALITVFNGTLLFRLSLKVALLWTLFLSVSLIVGQLFLFERQLSVQLMLPLCLVIASYGIHVIKYFFTAYQDIYHSLPESVESNRLLGLAYQGQGLLDLAFDRFRLCPTDDNKLGLLYNLALDYELKQQPRRAMAVYRYLLHEHHDYRDAEQRLEKLRQISTSLLRADQRFRNWVQEGEEKFKLGRYLIERELGKGAMGVVYLGRDPKLNRWVALKTLPLSQEFVEEELEEALIRFIREATAAARLKHPNIISIYDAGEEQDLAYISMEYFKGGNLVPYTQPDQLLPVPTVVDITLKIAEALDYAWQNGVVHRDIKPANIMYNPVDELLKITDFGIARLTDGSKTKTGVILGTPSYMSPEQLQGKIVDGRSDLYSLGIMSYQLLTGQLPFQADTMATLMFKIANETPAPLRTLRPELPNSLEHIIHKMLQKQPDQRYHNGRQLAQALRDCLISGEH